MGRPIVPARLGWYIRPLVYPSGIMLGLVCLAMFAMSPENVESVGILLPLGIMLVIAHTIATVVRVQYRRSTGTTSGIVCCTVGQLLTGVVICVTCLHGARSALGVTALSILVGVVLMRIAACQTFERTYFGVESS